MIVLGIESTAHTFGIGIVENKKILANARDVYKPKIGWGIVPAEAAEHHRNMWQDILAQALTEANINLNDIELIAWAAGPGLPPCLAVGAQIVKKIKEKIKKPVIAVNHCVAHIEIAKLLTKASDPVILYVSGGNSQIIAYNNGFYRIFGETQDIGIGNALDKFGREAGLPFPTGPHIESLALTGKWIELPYTVKGMDFVFSGIITEALKKLKSGTPIEDLCFSLQEVCFAMLTEVAERAMAHTGKNELLLTGGVGANARLKSMLATMCAERGAKFFTCPANYAGDNGVMVAWTGLLAWQSGQRTKVIKQKPRWRTDSMPITWNQ
jgi:N6-L-threonylcarbamoyladenine synthase